MSVYKNKVTKTVKFLLPKKEVKMENNVVKETKHTEDGNIPQNEDEEIQQYTKIVIFFLKSMAMLPIFSEHPSKLLNSINIFYILFVNFISVHITLFSMADLYFSWDGDVFNLTFNMINTVIYIMNTILLIYFQVYWKDLDALLKRLDKTFKFESAPGLTTLNMKTCFKMARQYSLTFSISCILSATHWGVMPLIKPSEDGVRLLPLKIWYPMNVQVTPCYEIAYTTQMFGQIMVAIGFANFAILYMSECILICGQFDILCCSLRNIRFTALLSRGFKAEDLVPLVGYQRSGSNRCTLPEDEMGEYFCGNAKVYDPLLKAMDSEVIYESSLKEDSSEDGEIDNIEIDPYEAYDEEVISAIKGCAVHHQEILDYCESFKKFCSPISFVKMLQITLLVCFVMYSFSVSFQITILEYGTLTCVDLFLLCYFGNEIMLRSSKVGIAVCGGPWHILSPKARKYLIPILMRTNRPVSFTGGKFYKLTLESFIGVLKVSFSYFTLLRNINESQNKF